MTTKRLTDVYEKILLRMEEQGVPDTKDNRIFLLAKTRDGLLNDPRSEMPEIILTVIEINMEIQTLMDDRIVDELTHLVDYLQKRLGYNA